VEGMMDTSNYKSRHTFFLENQIKIYGVNGETVFNLITNDYISTGAKIDSTKKALLFRTFRSNSFSTYTGFEIYGIAGNTLLHKFETDSSYMVSEPVLFGNYVIVEVFKNQIPIDPEKGQWIPYITIVYDISKNTLYQWKYPKKYKFQFPMISGTNLIYHYGDDENIPIEYDTIPVHSLDTLDAALN
jgi:hypothetical protein